MEFFSITRWPWPLLFMHFLVLQQILQPSQSLTTTPTLFGNSTDRHALLSFKSTVSTDDAKALASWNDTVGFCKWPGITCDSRHPDRVTALSLDTLGLGGAISPALGNLTFLTSLNLPGNNLHGSIPQELGRLPRLQYLNLSSNKLQGEIPANLSRCSNLEVIFLSHNMLTGEIPSELGSLQKLQVLYLIRNNLTGTIPTSIGNLTSLTDLYLSENSLKGRIPPELGNIAGLLFLSLGSNQLSGNIPPSLCNFSSLSAFDVAANLLSGTLPPDLGQNLPNLLDLRMYDNHFEGLIPSSLANASSLQWLELGKNKFTGVVPPSLGAIATLSILQLGDNKLQARSADEWSFITSLAGCSNLNTLDLSNNDFSGSLPDSIGNLSRQLDGLWLSENKIAGSIPPGIGLLRNLTQLVLEGNLLSGPIPSTLGNLESLHILSLRNNKLSGEIPSSIGSLTKMLELYLSHNNLSGSLPGSFNNLHKLEVLDLSYNNLNGNIPKGLPGISSLSRYLNLSHNSISGPLPDEVGKLINLQAFDVSENKLSGRIPASLGQCQVLDYLNLEGNYFNGTIPEDLRNLKGIQFLDFSRNQLSGSIPRFLENLNLLRNLNLSFNNFEGEVPKNGIFSDLSPLSILGIQNLCGGNSSLNLMSCTRKRHGVSKIVIVSLVVVPCCSLLLFCLLYKYYRKQVSKKSGWHTTARKDQFLQISYAELFGATDGFSPPNLVGAGGFGSVYKGTLEHDGMEIAVKVFDQQLSGASKSFMAECNALRNIRHRNLVKILTSCSSVEFNGNEFRALVYEFMPNGSLETWLHADACSIPKLRNLNAVQRFNIALDVASALDYLHNQTLTPIVHCDLKPSNILLDDGMIARVSDFGIARFLSTKIESSTIEIKGSIGYIAPECGMGTPISTLWDVYSYGILLLELFTGKRPTDSSFKDGLSLRKYVEASFPDHIMDVLDPQMFPQEINERVKERICVCLVSIIRIALVCSKESQGERMQMNDVVKHFEVIKDIFAEVRGNGKI